MMKNKKVIWPSLQVKFKHRMCARMNEELRVAEYGMEVCCEPKQGSILRDRENDKYFEKNPFEGKHMMTKTLIEAKEHSAFKSNNWLMVTKFIGDEHSIDFSYYNDEGQLISVIIENEKKTKFHCKGNQGGDSKKWINTFMEEEHEVTDFYF